MQVYQICTKCKSPLNDDDFWREEEKCYHNNVSKRKQKYRCRNCNYDSVWYMDYTVINQCHMCNLLKNAVEERKEIGRKAILSNEYNIHNISPQCIEVNPCRHLVEIRDYHDMEGEIELDCHKIMEICKLKYFPVPTHIQTEYNHSKKNISNPIKTDTTKTNTTKTNTTKSNPTESWWKHIFG